LASTKPPRKHHYISQFLLSGFTADGTQDGLLYVSDLKERKCWPASGTANAGHKRDLYELDIEGIVGLDPMAAEKGLAVIEGRTAAILNSMGMQPSAMLSQEDLRQILYFIALQVGRVPGERPRVEEAYGRLESALETPESWEIGWKRSGAVCRSGLATAGVAETRSDDGFRVTALICHYGETAIAAGYHGHQR